MNSDQNKIVIFAAGTGGHIYPGISIAKELIQNGFSVLWVGTKKGIENKIVPEAEILIEYVNFSGLRGKGLFAYIKLPFNLLRAIIQSIVLIRKYKPQIALSMGGYISFPCCIASYILRIPIVIHEQNIIFGMANNILRHLSKKVILGFPMNLKNIKYKYLGNPSRYENINKKVKIKSEKKINILVVGGSLGAKIFNEVIPKTIYSLKETTKYEINVIHQTGKTIKTATDQYRNIDVNIDIREYIDPMINVYEWCDIIICRGGAITLTELMNLGIASIIVPFPYATDNHQMKNSRYLESHDAAIVINQKNFTHDHLASIIKSFIENPELKQSLSENILKLNKKDATKNICDEIISEIENN